MIAVCKTPGELADALFAIRAEPKLPFPPQVRRQLFGFVELAHDLVNSGGAALTSYPELHSEKLPVFESVGGMFWPQYLAALADDAAALNKDAAAETLRAASAWLGRRYRVWIADAEYQEFLYATGQVPVGGWR